MVRTTSWLARLLACRLLHSMKGMIRAAVTAAVKSTI
jgi:hypothetical protein